MNKPNAEAIRMTLEERRERAREEMRREEAAMDAFAVRAVRVLAQGFEVAVAEEDEPWTLGASDEPTPMEPAAETTGDARRAIEERRYRVASPSPAPERGEPPLRAALRGIVASYAEPITPSEETVSEVEANRGIALDEADTDGLWAQLELGEVLGVRAAMADAVETVTSRIESAIVDELVAARLRLAAEYPDVPLLDGPETTAPVS